MELEESQEWAINDEDDNMITNENANAELEDNSNQDELPLNDSQNDAAATNEADAEQNPDVALLFQSEEIDRV